MGDQKDEATRDGLQADSAPLHANPALLTEQAADVVAVVAPVAEREAVMATNEPPFQRLLLSTG